MQTIVDLKVTALQIMKWQDAALIWEIGHD